MASFEIDGIKLEIPDDCLSPQLTASLDSGRYESTESHALKRHLVPGDRVVDLGAGAGYLCALAARIVGGQNVLGVEGNPAMAPVARANLRRNGSGDGTILHGAVVGDEFKGDTVQFLARQAFWAGSIDQTGETRARHVDVPVLRLGDVLARHEPSLVIMDIEGAEADLAGYPWPEPVRMVIMEVHTNRYPADALHKSFTGFFDVGFTYCPWGSRAETLVFERVKLP